jgi:hypothetical protein
MKKYERKIPNNKDKAISEAKRIYKDPKITREAVQAQLRKYRQMENL